VTGPVRVRRCEPPAVTPETVAVVPDMLLPLLGWRDVPVLREIRQELTALERFVLEMALTLGSLTSEDFTEVVSLPRQVLTAGASRLLGGGALRLVADTYEVEPDAAARVLREAAVRRQVPATADFVLLPRTGDLLEVAGKKKSWLRQLELARLVPGPRAPVPDELWDQRRSSYLAARVRQGTVALLDPGMVDVPVPDDDAALVAASDAEAAAQVRLCPTYRCRAEVTRDEQGGGYAVRAVLHGTTEARRGKQGNGTPARTVEIPVELTGAQHLVAKWLTLAAGMDDPGAQRATWREIGPPARYGTLPFLAARRRGPMEWEFPLAGRAARAIAEQRRALGQPIGVMLENTDAAVSLICSFAPADDEARVLFARDEAVSRLLAATDPLHELPIARRAAGAAFGVAEDRLPSRAIGERAWDLGGYRLAYALRESEDFPYD
jgi:hypothetical protein